MNARLLPSLIVVVFLLITAFVVLANSPALVQWQGSTEIAAGHAVKGPWQQNQSHYDYVDDPAVALHASGNVAVAWVDQKRKDVFFQALGVDGSRQGPAVNVSGSPQTFSWLPRVVTIPDQPHRIFIIWQEIIFSGGSHGGEIFFSRSEDGGRSFSAPLNLSNSVGGDGKGRINATHWSNGSLDLAYAGDDLLYASWTEYDGALWFARSTNGGNSFSAPQRIAGDNLLPARAPALAAGPGQTVYVAWTTGEDPATNIHLAQSDDGGTSFSPPQQIFHSSGYADAPRIQVDHNGVLHLVYAETVKGPFSRSRIFYTRSTDGCSFAERRELFPAALDSQLSAGFPNLSVDAQGGVYVIWEMFSNAQSRPHGLVMTVSYDGGHSFAQPFEVPGSADPAGGSNGSQQGLLTDKLAVNAAGTIVIANSSFQPGTGSRVWLMHGVRSPQAKNNGQIVQGHAAAESSRPGPAAAATGR